MIWIVGAGYMAKEYVKVLKVLNEQFLVIGKSEKNTNLFAEQEGVAAVAGGLDRYLAQKPQLPSHVIVCTPVNSLAEITLSLIKYGIASILVEKPGALSKSDLLEVEREASKAGCKVLIGYNRRFYQAVMAVEQLIDRDGGITAVNFEITEWAHNVDDDPSAPEVKEKWMLANTSHVIDLAFYIGGQPVELCSFASGKLPWHSSGSRFVGAGITNKNALLSYMGYWDGPGRWSVEFVTTKHRYILRPMERLAVQKVGSVAVSNCENIDYSLDEKFKPGLYLQTKAFLSGDCERFCTLPEQIRAYDTYNKIASYKVDS